MEKQDIDGNTPLHLATISLVLFISFCFITRENA
ncbi:BnaC09g00740D [Brassica napus]|uniref:(rape) hypothetical protein n=1 Tax=Brassica napus TaxID=3708 RepID=A0A078GBA7_BRANA|nr:unnamed protein product [Brassica napus]CDY21968.1 BnaC09g00740D [Brassica napus]